METVGQALAYFVTKVALGAKVNVGEIRYIVVKDRVNLGSPMRLGNMPIIEVGIYGKPTQDFVWCC